MWATQLDGKPERYDWDTMGCSQHCKPTNQLVIGG